MFGYSFENCWCSPWTCLINAMQGDLLGYKNELRQTTESCNNIFIYIYVFFSGLQINLLNHKKKKLGLWPRPLRFILITVIFYAS